MAFSLFSRQECGNFQWLSVAPNDGCQMDSPWEVRRKWHTEKITLFPQQNIFFVNTASANQNCSGDNITSYNTNMNYSHK